MTLSDTIPALFDDACARFGERTAVVCGPRTWSYAELGRRARGLAGRLADAGVRTGDRVAVLDGNTPGFLVAYLGAPLAGALLQPLNHRLAAPELRAVLADAETRVVLAGDGFRERARALGGPTVLALEECAADDGGRARLAGAPGSPGPDDPAQLYYTSGTTGRPKGVVLTHRNVTAHAHAAVSELTLVADDRWGHFAPLFHLADAWATFAVTAVGGAHVCLPRFEAEAALRTVERDRVTLTNLVPTMLTALVAHPAAAELDLSSLRLVLSGGAPITPALVRRVLATFRCEYAQTYGMTETSPYLTLGLLTEQQRALPDDERLRLRCRTGRPFEGVTLEVVDELGVRVPADDRAVGEIRVRGATVTPGYWRRPEETAAAIRDGWLYTGDLATVDGQGFVDIVDRRKDVILTGGETVYSVEVENALAEHPAVLASAVYGVPDASWGERVCAAVVLAAGRRADEDELTDWCRARIAGYKVPRRVRFVAELPRIGSGKVSKAVLREEARAQGGPGRPGGPGGPGQPGR